MIVVSDTTHLISFLKIKRLDLLEELFGEIIIPKAVFQELTIDSRFTEEAEYIKSQSFISVRNVQNMELQKAGRHIGQRHYQMLLSKLKD